MATITITIDGQDSITNTYNLSDEQLDRMVDAYQDAGNAAAGRVATRDEVLTTWSEELMSATTSQIRNFEVQQALQVAATGLKSLPSVVSEQKAVKIAEREAAAETAWAAEVAASAAAEALRLKSGRMPS